MSATNLGRRYERLLFLAAPLSFAALLLIFVAVASTNQKERVAARCYEAAATALEENKVDLQKAFDKEKPIDRNASWGIYYKLAIQKVFIYALLTTPCYEIVNGQIDQRYRAAPDDVIIKLRQEASAITSVPIHFGGVELPDKATLGMLGTTVKIEIMTFTRTLQVVLAPLMLLWLGSLYNTRYRESLLIGSSKLLSDVFPHLINVYPAFRYPEPRKRSWIQYHVPAAFAFMYACTRIALLLVFVGPPVVAYVASLFLLDSDEYRYVFVSMGLLVAIFALATVLAEFFPWHYRKVFPGPSIAPIK